MKYSIEDAQRQMAADSAFQSVLNSKLSFIVNDDNVTVAMMMVAAVVMMTTCQIDLSTTIRVTHTRLMLHSSLRCNYS